jgi:MYXO-CTERM domain-containing protein
MGKCTAVATGDAGADDGGSMDSGPIDFDGGFGDDDASMGSDAGSSNGFADAGKEDSGCGCTTAGLHGTPSSALALLGLALVLVRRRR